MKVFCCLVSIHLSLCSPFTYGSSTADGNFTHRCIWSINSRQLSVRQDYSSPSPTMRLWLTEESEPTTCWGHLNLALINFVGWSPSLLQERGHSWKAMFGWNVCWSKSSYAFKKYHPHPYVSAHSFQNTLSPLCRYALIGVTTEKQPLILVKLRKPIAQI